MIGDIIQRECFSQLLGIHIKTATSKHGVATNQRRLIDGMSDHHSM